MVERKFNVIDNYDFKREYDGVDIPQQWQAWETAHFLRVKAIISHPEAGARLISYGCNNDDGGTLNCTTTCRNTTLMYNSPENLWNCVTLATVAMLAGPGNDTINQTNVEEMDEKFHFESLDAVNGLDIFQRVRECAWSSCSDSKYGACTASFQQFKCAAVSPKNIASFGDILQGPYCKAAGSGIDFDIAGQGVSKPFKLTGQCG